MPDLDLVDEEADLLVEPNGREVPVAVDASLRADAAIGAVPVGAEIHRPGISLATMAFVDRHQLSMSLATGPDRREQVIADRLTVHDGDQQPALGISNRSLDPSLIEGVATIPREPSVEVETGAAVGPCREPAGVFEVGVRRLSQLDLLRTMVQIQQALVRPAGGCADVPPPQTLGGRPPPRLRIRRG